MVRALGKKVRGPRSARGAIEIFDRGARITILTHQKGRVVVSDLVEVDFPPVAEGQSLPASVKAGALREALRARGWRLREAVLVLPKNVVTMRLVALPSTEDAELAEMARFEAQKHIPFNVERHVVAHAVLRKEGVEGSRTLTVAVDRAALEEPIAICRQARIDLASAGVSSLASVEALLLDPPAGHETRTFGLVNIGWSTVDITIVSDGIVRFTRGGTMGVARITPILEEALGKGTSLRAEYLEALDALAPQAFFERRGRPRRREPVYSVDDFTAEEMDETTRKGTTASGLVRPTENEQSAGLSGPAGEIAKWLERIVQEIQRTHTFAAREFDCPELESLYLVGIGSCIANMDQYLQRHLRCPVALLNPPPSLEFATGGGRDLRAGWREFAITIAAAAGTALPPVNLLPPEYIEAVRTLRRRRSLAISGALVFLLVVPGLVYLAQQLANQRHLLEFYRSHNRTLEPKVKMLRDKERRYKIVKRIVDDPLSAAAVLDAIGQLEAIRWSDDTGKRKVTLVEYHYVKGQGVALEGHALDHTELERFVVELGKNRCFDMVTQKGRTPTKLSHGRPDVVNYTLQCEFPKSARR